MTATRTALESTSAFYRTSPGIRLFRWTLGTAQRLWPALAVRAAYRLFGTPLPPKWLRRSRAWDANWRIERWPFEQAALTVYSQAGGAARPGGAAGARLGRPCGPDAAAGGSADAAGAAPGAGRNARPRTQSPARSATCRNSRAPSSTWPRACCRTATPCARVVAHSLAANAAAYAASRGLAAERLVLLAPPASPREYTRLFAHVFGLTEATRAAMQKRIEAREGILMPQFEPDAVGPRIRVPTLVVHDREDSINRFADGMAYAHAIRDAQLIATQGLGHRKILQDVEVLARIAIFTG